jgi:hypothetical protein
MPTTISVDTDVRDRLKAYCPPGTSYSEAITRILDLIEADRFFASFRGAIEDKKYRWVDESDFEWS